MTDEVQTAYKIVEKDKAEKQLRTLFRGINRDRDLNHSEWIEAEIKQGRDGSDSPYYKTGIHVLPTLEDAEDYMDHFRTELDGQKEREIIEVKVKGNRRKPTNNRVILADAMYIPRNEYLQAVAQ